MPIAQILHYLPFFLFLVVAFVLLSNYVNTKKRSKIAEENSTRTFQAIWEIEKAVLETLDFNEATKRVVNIILTQLGYLQLGYEVIVLTLLDEKQNHLRRIAISQTEAAAQFLKASPIPFQDIIIPLSATDNLLVKAIVSKQKYVTEQVSDVLYPAINREWVNDFQESLHIKTSIVYPIQAKDKVLGSLIFSLSKDQKKITPYEWSILESFVGAVGIALDNALLFKSVTDVRDELKQANERLEQLDKLKDEFVSLASHELRTPMTAIKSYLWFFLTDNKDKVEAKELLYLQRAYESTNRLIELVNDMLNVSRIESGRLIINLAQIDPLTLVQDVVTELSPVAQKQQIVLLVQKPSTQLPAVSADSNKIKEVLINLIGNALKFTPEHGSITISLALQDGMVQCSVADTGKGIQAVDMPKLFQKFNQVGRDHLSRASAAGTGLGLYISKSIIELHGGKIWAESLGEDKGTTFHFTLKTA
jgi:signal transduction histidine kinase